MRPNRMSVFQFEQVQAAREVLPTPKGDLFRCGINPWSGDVVFSYQDSPEGRFYTSVLLDALKGATDFEFQQQEMSSPCAVSLSALEGAHGA